MVEISHRETSGLSPAAEPGNNAVRFQEESAGCRGNPVWGSEVGEEHQIPWTNFISLGFPFPPIIRNSNVPLTSLFFPKKIF